MMDSETTTSTISETPAPAPAPAGAQVELFKEISFEVAAPVTAPVVPVSKQEPEVKKEQEVLEPEQPRDSEGKFKKAESAQDRIDELTRARRQAERESEYWRMRAQTPIAAEKVISPPKPAREDFKSDADHIEAVIDWRVAEAVSRATRETTEKVTETIVHSQNASKQVDEWRGRVIEAKKSIPDFDAVMSNATMTVEPHITEALLKIDVGPGLAYHLAKNPDVLERLNGMSPADAMLEIGGLVVGIRNKAAPAAPTAPVENRALISKAPDPIQSSGVTQSSAPVDISTMSMDEYVKHREQLGLR